MGDLADLFAPLTARDLLNLPRFRMAIRTEVHGERLVITPEVLREPAQLGSTEALQRSSDRRDGRAQPEIGLIARLPQRVSALLFDGYLRPDAIAGIRVRERTILAFIEQDSGSERPPVVVRKLGRYRAVLASRREVTPAHVLFVVQSPRRLRSVREAFRRSSAGNPSPTVWFVLEPDLRGDPWSAPLHSVAGEELRAIELSGHRSRSFEPSGWHCLLRGEQGDAIDERGLSRLPMLDHFRSRSGV